MINTEGLTTLDQKWKEKLSKITKYLNLCEAWHVLATKFQ